MISRPSHNIIKTGVIFLIVLLLGGIFWWSSYTRMLNMEKACAFCSPDVIKTHTFYDDKLVRGLCSYKPVEPGHCLIVIKRHIETLDQASDEEMMSIGRLIKKINQAMQHVNGPSAYLILQKNGGEVGQTVPHVHVHYIPKQKNHNRISPFGILWSFIRSPFKGKLTKEQLSFWVSKMKQAFKNLEYHQTHPGISATCLATD